MASDYETTSQKFRGPPTAWENPSTMCHRVTCPKCGKPTWAGCGRHVEEALRGVPPEKRCSCPPPEPLWKRLVGKPGR